MKCLMKIYTMKIVLVVFSLLVMSALAQELDQTEQTTVDQLCSNGTDDSCEAFSGTEIPTTSAVEVTSEVTITSTPSQKPKTTTTAKSGNKKPSPSPVSNKTTPIHPQPDCTCDVTRGGCEVNCCCDADCGPQQRAVFTHCVAAPQALAVDSDHCLPPQLLYRNNTDHKAVETDAGVLCVVQQNTFASTDFSDVPVGVVTTTAALTKKIGRDRYYSWPNPSPSPLVFDSEAHYQHKSPVWITDNVTITALVLPSSTGHNTLCRGSVKPLYLEDTETSCAKPLTTQTECLGFAEARFSVISSPCSYNFTQPQDCTEDVCLPVRNFVCAGACVEVALPRPVYNATTSTCLNLVEDVEYKVYHNGSQGIVEVRAFYTLRNITVRRDQLIRRRYRVTHLWASSTDQPVFRRSGNPGYHRGKPLVSGRRNETGTTYNFSESDWISVGVAGGSGHCQNRYNLLFGENVRTQCLLTVKGTCKQIQQQIWQQMLGPVANLSEAVISSYGDPEEGEGWVPLLSSEPPPPPALTSAVNILVLHSLVGPAARPGAKVIAAYLHFLPSVKTCNSNHMTVVVESSVKFIDKTFPAVTKFAAPPVYEIKLPQDFFYPFLSSSNEVYPGGYIFILVVTCLVI